MIISCLYPKKIYIDDEKTKEQVEKTFGVNVNLDEWFSCPQTEIKIYDDGENKNHNVFINNMENANIKTLNACVKVENNEKNTIHNEDFDIKNNFNNNIQNSQKITYIVKPMDTFEKVSTKINIPVEQLKQIAKTKNLFVGQRIDIIL